MSEKVKLPKDVCDALDAVKKEHITSTIMYRHLENSWHSEYEVISEINTDLLMRALVLGYEPEMTAEEQLKERYLSNYYSNSYKNGMQETLKVLRIHYDWMDDAE